MTLHPTPLPGVLLLKPQIHPDKRGLFFEAYNAEKLAKQGFDIPFVQDNVSLSHPNVLRGLHYQWPTPQGKLVQCLAGAVWDVAVDIRQGSPTFGQWHAEELTQENRHALYIPEGFAHGFCVLGQSPALLAYKCTAPFRSDHDAGLAYNDPELNLPWPIQNPIVSEKDLALPHLRQIPPEKQPQ